MPCCFDALSARMTERAGFDLTFMSGFAVSAARLGKPDTGLISYGEMLDQGRNICDAIEIPGQGAAHASGVGPSHHRSGAPPGRHGALWSFFSSPTRETSPPRIMRKVPCRVPSRR